MIKYENILSIDIESWVHKYFINHESSIKKTKDNGYIYDSTIDILNILDQYNIKTTFFIVGEIFDWHPLLIDKIEEKGHEIGFHTYSHTILSDKESLINELQMGKNFIDTFDIKGFRAPEVLIKKEHLNVLKDWGFTYDSSIYSKFNIFEPIQDLLEVPISTFQFYSKQNVIEFPSNFTPFLLLREIPFGSGFFIGLLGDNIEWFIKQSNTKNIAASLVIHPWQIIIPPKENIDFKDNLLHRLKMIPYNINRRNTFEYLCKKYQFIPIKKLINDYNYNAEKIKNGIES